MKRRPKTSSVASVGILIFIGLFGMPFLGVGVFMGYGLATMLVEWNAARGWVRTDATIKSIELDQHSDSEGGTTERVLGTYEYEHDGRKHTG